MREIRISPDGNAVAIRSDNADGEAWNAWGVMNALAGGHWASTQMLDEEGYQPLAGGES